MEKVFDFLKGKKSYFLGLAAVIYALAGWYLGKIDPTTALDIIWAGLTAVAIRAGIKNDIKGK
jgi:hypothetical protein